MKIWFDLSNSPHINLFANIIHDLEKEHEVIITCRPLANTIELLQLHNFKFEVIGKHYGKNIFKKSIGFPVRVLQLVNHFKKNKPDIAIGQSSFQFPIAAKILGIPSLYMNDNEHALGNIPSFIFADKIMIPEFLDRKKVHRQFGKNSKIIEYPGVKEGIYLWRLLKNINEKENNVSSYKKTILFRPEPRTAQYYKGKLNFIDPLILELKQKYEIIISPRDNEQKKHYNHEKFSGIRVLDNPMDIVDIIKQCDLFIGAGGTMTREMAVAGIPTISVYQDKLLDVDKYLIENKFLIHTKKLTSEIVDSALISYKDIDNKILLSKGRESEQLIINTILEMCKERPC